MSTINEKAIRVVAFSGKSKDYRMWAARFMAAAQVKKYHRCLIEDFSKQVVVKKEGESGGDGGSSQELTEAQIEMVMRAYTDIMLACSDEVSFGIVFNSKSIVFPEGDAYMAWDRLRQKHEPNSSAYEVMLRKSFHQSRLKKTEDPDEWIEELDIIRYRLGGLGVQISEEELVLQIIEGLPSMYDSLVVLLNGRNNKGELTLIELREKLKTFYDRHTRRSGRKTDDKDVAGEETALVAGTFKGRCRGCGEYGHKKADCPKEKSNRGAAKKFTGKYYHCGKKGHKKSECWALKKQREQGNVAEWSGQGDEEEYTFVTLCEQASDVGIEPSWDVLDKDIVDWEAGVRGESKDILDYNDDYLEISTSSWSNMSSWDDAKIDSEDENSVGMSSFSTLDSENRFMALCCWHDDNESVIESNNDDDEPAVEITEIEKHQEIDNVMSHEEQVEME